MGVCHATPKRDTLLGNAITNDMHGRALPTPSGALAAWTGFTGTQEVTGSSAVWYSVTIDPSGAGEGHPGEVYVHQTLDDPTDPPTPRQVDVNTFNSSRASSSDTQFDPVVHC